MVEFALRYAAQNRKGFDVVTAAAATGCIQTAPAE